MLQKSFVAKNHSLLVAKILLITCCKNALVTHCKICSLLVAEVACCKKSLVTRCKIHLLLVTKFTRYSLQTLLVAKNHSLLFAKIHSLLVAKFAHYLLQKLLVPKNHWFLVAKIPSIHIAKNHFSLKQSPAGIIVCLKSTKLDESFSSYFRFSYLNSRTSTKRRIQVNLHTCLVLV